MNKIFPVLIFLFGIFLGACNPGKAYRHEASVVDSLRVSLDEVVQEYQKWDVEELSAIKEKVDVNLSKLTSVIKANKDTLSRKHAIMLGDYKSSAKVFRDVAGKNRKFLESIELSEKQLNLLKSDIEKGAITNRDTLNYYLNGEKEAVGKLIDGLQRANKGFNLGREKYKMINPTVEHILDSLINRNDN